MLAPPATGRSTQRIGRSRQPAHLLHLDDVLADQDVHNGNRRHVDAGAQNKYNARLLGEVADGGTHPRGVEQPQDPPHALRAGLRHRLRRQDALAETVVLPLRRGGQAVVLSRANAHGEHHTISAAHTGRSEPANTLKIDSNRGRAGQRKAHVSQRSEVQRLLVLRARPGLHP